MKLLTVIGLFLDLVGVVILGLGEVMKGAASLRDLKESYTDSWVLAKEVGLLPPPRLRTGRESFPSSGSSLE